MPELPEVETVRRQLLPVILDTTITDVEVYHAKTVAYDETIEDTLSGQCITHIDRIGKLLIFSFRRQPDLFLLAHLKMTGQFLFVDPTRQVGGGGHSLSARDISTLPNTHTRLALTFASGTILYFNDMRLFGYVKLANAAEVTRVKATFGPEPHAADFDPTWFSTRLRRRKTSVKAALLDQSFVAGLGNIYVDEALFRAGIRPSRRADRVLAREAIHLATTAGDVLRESLAVGGTTFQHFMDTSGQAGNFTDYLQVFGRHTQPCLVCGTPIVKTRVAGRGTHYCPTCQR